MPVLCVKKTPLVDRLELATPLQQSYLWAVESVIVIMGFQKVSNKKNFHCEAAAQCGTATLFAHDIYASNATTSTIATIVIIITIIGSTLHLHTLRVGRLGVENAAGGGGALRRSVQHSEMTPSAVCI